MSALKRVVTTTVIAVCCSVLAGCCGWPWGPGPGGRGGPRGGYYLQSDGPAAGPGWAAEGGMRQGPGPR